VVTFVIWILHAVSRFFDLLVTCCAEQNPVVESATHCAVVRVLGRDQLHMTVGMFA